MNRYSSVPISNSLRACVALALLLVGTATAHAQTVAADRIRLNAGPCTIDSVNGSPDQVRLSDCSTITTATATNLTLQPTGDLVLSPTGVDVLPNTGYTVNLGALSNKYLTLHAAELWVETLVAQNTIATIGGRVLVAPTTALTADLAPAGTTITVKHNQMASGDRVYLEANGAVEFMAITSAASGSGPYTYSVTRNLDGSGANQWYAGDAMLNTGTTGNGFIDLYSTAGVLSGSGPTIVGNVRTGTTYNNIAPRWAIGNLNGLYGYGATTYGAAFGDSSATNLTIDATNGLRIRSGTTNKLVANTSGDLSLTGAFSIGTSGSFSSGATAYGTGTGWWMDYNAGTPRFRIGNPAGSQLTWDGSALTVVGDVRVFAGTGRNLIRNSDCAASTTDWTSATNSAATMALSGPSTVSPYRLKDVADNTCRLAPSSGTPANGTLTYAQAASFTVVAGQRYEASAYIGLQNSTSAYVRLWFMDAAETTTIAIYDGSSCTTASAGGAELASWCRSGVVQTAPVGSQRARVLVQVNHSGAASSAMYFVHSYFGEAGAGQTEFTPWGPAGLTEIVGGMIKTGTITAANIAASTITANELASNSVTAGKINVTTLAAINANMGSITAGSMNIGSGAFTLAGNGDTHISVLDVDVLQPDDITVQDDLVVISSGSINFSPLGGGGDQFVCVDNGGNLYASPTVCN